MIDISLGRIELSEELVVDDEYSFEKFVESKYYSQQDGSRVFWLDDRFAIGENEFAVSLFFLKEKIYLISLFCTDFEYSFEDEIKRKDEHDKILLKWGVSVGDYPWGQISSNYDIRSNISSIDIVFTKNVK